MVRYGVRSTRRPASQVPSPSPIETFVPFGGRLCLDLANTVNGRLTDAPDDLLAHGADLAAFGHKMGLLSAADAARLADVLAAEPQVASACLARAVALRETLFSVFHAVAVGGQPSPAWTADLIRAHGQSVSDTHLVREAATGSWAWEARTDLNPPRLGWLLFPVTRSALDLLTSPADLSRLKRCAGADRGCGGLFVDDSRNAIRRWCSMGDCGSRAKMRRLYARRRAGHSAPA